MKSLFLKPEMEISKFTCDDVVCTSFDDLNAGTDNGGNGGDE